METASLIFGVLGLLATIVAIWLSRDQIKDFFRSQFPRHSISIFGPKAAGKTTLVRYLQGKPIPRQHIDTFGAQPVGKVIYDLSGNKTYYFRSREMYDVGGEHHNQWNAIIKKQNPAGIIFVIDTTNESEEVGCLNEIHRIYNEWGAEELAQNINLKALLVLINKADIWGNNPNTREMIINNYRDGTLANAINMLENEFTGVRVQFGWSSLTHAEYQQQNNMVLRNFVMTLDEQE